MGGPVRDGRNKLVILHFQHQGGILQFPEIQGLASKIDQILDNAFIILIAGIDLPAHHLFHDSGEA